MSNTLATCLLAVALSTTGPLLHADDKPAAPDGYNLVPVQSANGATSYIKVKKQLDPYQNVSASNSSGKYDPTSLNFNQASSFSNKQFLPAQTSTSTTDSYADSAQNNTFAAKPYVNDTSSKAAHSIPNQNTQFSLPTASAYDQSASIAQKSFITPAANTAQNKTATLATSSPAGEQDRTAVLGSEKTETYASPLATKQYLGPGAQQVPEGITIKENVVLSRMSDIPNRPLSIDEVRDLINHETKPNLDEKPEPPSKPLNDPDYKPEPSPAPPPVDDDKNDPVPPPGMMANPQPPENSEPLPQH